MSRWRETTLEETTELLTGFPFKSAKYTHDENGIALVRGDNVVQGRFRWDDVKRWPKRETAEISNYFLQTGDVILAMDRPWIDAGLKYACVADEDLPCLLVQRVTRLRARNGLDQGFLRYIIGSKEFTDYVLAVQTGTAVPHISSGQIKQFRFQCPPSSEQRAIASVLGALDDKIELNRRMNETLEALAQSLFKSRFVAPTQSALPKGWREVPFAETVEIIGGGTPKTSVAEYWGGDTPWFSVVDSPQGSDLFVIETEKKITQAGIENSSTQLLPVGTTIITARGTVGKIALVGVPMAMNQSCYGLRGKAGKKGFHTYFVTRALVSQLQQHAHGSVFDTITRDTLAGVQVALPPAELVEQFEEKVSPLMERILNNLHESQTLAALRDALLPKLLSGELRAPATAGNHAEAHA